MKIDTSKPGFLTLS